MSNDKRRKKVKWKRPSQFAKDKGVSLQVVNNWVRRGKLKRIYDDNNVPLVTTV